MSDYSDLETTSGVERDIVVGDKSAKYVIYELSAADAEDLFGVLAIGSEDAKAKAKVALRTKLIAACVSRTDGRTVTLAEARGFPTKLATALQDVIMEVNGLNVSDDESPKESKAGSDSGT